MIFSAVKLGPPRLQSGLFLLTTCLSFAAVPLYSQTNGPNALLSSDARSVQAQTGGDTAETHTGGTVPSGTILPVVLGSSFSFEKCKPGQILHGKIAQDVPLSNGAKIRKGSPIEGHVVEATRARTAPAHGLPYNSTKFLERGNGFLLSRICGPLQDS